MATKKSTANGAKTSNKKKTGVSRPYISVDSASDSSDGDDLSDSDVPPDDQEEWQRPKGHDQDAYIGWEAWTPGQWAWEFLRRNKDFQRFCRGCELKPTEKDLVEEKFHLKRFKDFRAGYDNQTPLFSRSVRFFPTRNEFKNRLLEQPATTKSRTKPIATHSTEVVVTFRLWPAAFLGKKSLRKQLNQAEHRLESYLEILQKVHSYGKGGHAFRSSDLIKRLRALDLDKSGYSAIDIGAMLIEECSPENTELSLREVQKKGSALKVEAEEIEKREYFKLASLTKAKLSKPRSSK